MPLYEYQCEACGERFEQIRKFSDPPLEVCAKCGKGPVQKLISSPAIQFKGTGWYVTDYAGKGKSGGEKGEKGEKSEKGEEGKKGEKGEKGAGESTPAAAKAESGSATSESGGGSESKKSETPASTAAPSKDK